MATKIRAARMLVYSAAELKEAHEPYATEAAMAKVYASEVAMEVTNEALQIHGGNGYLKGMEVERMYRDAKITTIYEGTSEIQRLVISANIIGKAPKTEAAAAKKKPAGAVTGDRKKQIFTDGSAKEKIEALVSALKKDGFDFNIGIPIDTPIIDAERVVSVGKGIGAKDNMKLAYDLAKAAGAAIGSSRPVAETLRYLPLNRYVGMSGQKFRGNLYIAVGISGAGQHLNPRFLSRVFGERELELYRKRGCPASFLAANFCAKEAFAKALGTGEKQAAPPMVRMKKRTPKKLPPTYKLYVCGGCGYEYDKELGDDEGGIRPGTPFDQIPEEWTCPVCGDDKDQ